MMSPNQVLIPNSFFEDFYSDLSTADRSVYFALRFLASGQEQVAVTQDELGAFCKLSHPTIAQSRRHLEQMNLVKVLDVPRRNSATVYCLTHPERHTLQDSEHSHLERELWVQCFQAWLKRVEGKMTQNPQTMNGSSSNMTRDFFNQQVWPEIRGGLNHHQIHRLVDHLNEEQITRLVETSPTPNDL